MIKGAAVLLIVVGLGDRRAPVNDQRLQCVFRDTGTADIVLLRLLVRRKAEPDLCKIGGLQQASDSPEFFDGRVPLDIVVVDGMIHDLELDIGLHGIRVPVKVQGQVFPDVTLLLCGLLRDGADPAFEILLHFAQPVPGVGEVFLLPLENIVLHSFCPAFLIFYLSNFYLSIFYLRDFWSL